MSVDILRTEANERVDITDFEFISESVQAHERQLVDSFFCDPARTRKWVLSGFAMSNPAGSQLQVTKGKAIMATRIESSIEYGVLTTEGDATLTIDLNSYSPGDYGIYVRFERIAGDSQSRIFWNPTGSGSEYAQAVNTRYTAAWSLRVESSNPGADWMKIGEVAQATMTITDLREFYFEGATADTYESGWSTDGGGGANDRDSDRATYGCTDLQMALAAMRQCIEDVKGRGLRRWWDPAIGGLSVGFDTDPSENTVAIGDANWKLDWPLGNPRLHFDTDDYVAFIRGSDIWSWTLAGTGIFSIDADAIFPDDAGFSLGKGGSPFDGIYSNVLTLSTGSNQGVGSDLEPALDENFHLGNNRAWKSLKLASDDGEGCVNTFKPTDDDSVDLGGSNRRWQDLYLSGGLYLASGMGIFVGGTQEFSLSSTNLDPFADLGMSLGSASKRYSTVHAQQLIGDYDGGSSPFSPALKVTGTNPFILIADDDTGINDDHRHWSIHSTQGAGDIASLFFRLQNTAGTTDYEWLQVDSESGDTTVASHIYLKATEEIILQGTAGTRNSVTVAANGGTGPASSSYLGLTSDWVLGAAGTAFTIKGVSGTGGATSTGFLKIWAGGTARYIPFFDANTG